MIRLDRQAPPLQAAGDVQEAPQIARNYSVSPGGGDIIHLFVDDVGGNLGIFDAKRAAETATGLSLGRFPDHQIGNPAEKSSRLFLDAQFAETRTPIVISGYTLVFTQYSIDLQHVAEKLDKLMGAPGQGLSAGRPLGLVNQGNLNTERKSRDI